MTHSIQRRYALHAEGLWWLMQDSDDPERHASVVTCYCDDSGSDAYAFMGGPVLNRSMFLEFDHKWAKVLDEFRIEPPLHMTEFVRPYGKHIGMHHELKLALFTKVTRLIRNHRIYSVSIGIPLIDFDSLVSSEIARKLARPFTMALMVVVIVNNSFAEEHGYYGNIAYLVDRGSFGGQFADAYNMVCDFEKRTGAPSHPGNMAFGSDSENCALQAADVIVWAARRRHESGLTGEFKPLEKLFDFQVALSGKRTRPHFHDVLSREGIERFARGIETWITKRGVMPRSLVEALGPVRKFVP